jgi:hypothetical protein
LNSVFWSHYFILNRRLEGVDRGKPSIEHETEEDEIGSIAIQDTVDTNQIITALAYEFWQRRGCPIGSPELDWFKAEEYLDSWLQAEEDAKKRTESIREGGVIAINDLRRCLLDDRF